MICYSGHLPRFCIKLLLCHFTGLFARNCLGTSYSDWKLQRVEQAFTATQFYGRYPLPSYKIGRQ